MSYNWLPTMLADAGFDLPTSSRGLLIFNVGAIVAALLASGAIGSVGSRLPMLVMALGGAAGALAMSSMTFEPAASSVPLMTALALLGACIVGAGPLSRFGPVGFYYVVAVAMTLVAIAIFRGGSRTKWFEGAKG